MKFIRSMLSICCAAMAVPASALNISFDYSYDSEGFFTTERRAVMEQVANVFEARIQDHLTAITSSDTNQFDLVFTRPDTNTSITLSGTSVAADTLRVYVGGRDLPAGSLGFGGSGGFVVSGSSGFIDNAFSRGQSGALADPETDYGPWGGVITFDSSTSWYADSNAQTVETFSGFDLYSVALHEMGHVLGIGIANSWDGQISDGLFMGPRASAIYGAAVPVTADGGHWISGLQSFRDGVQQEAALTPFISAGARHYFTDIDWAALSDIGWQVSAVPEPTSALAFLMGLGVIVGTARRQSILHSSFGH